MKDGMFVRTDMAVRERDRGVCVSPGSWRMASDRLEKRDAARAEAATSMRTAETCDVGRRDLGRPSVGAVAIRRRFELTQLTEIVVSGIFGP
jgi:hypothetical protein